jgi:hypothetical protein
MITNQNFVNIPLVVDNEPLSTSVNSTNSYGSITQLNNAAAAMASASPQVKLEMNYPAIFSNKRKDVKKQETASAFLKSDDSDDELLGADDDTTLLIPDVQTTTTTTTDGSSKQNKMKKEFIKSV